ncbi:MAG: hypothetical protein KKD47_08670 [Proteobacteria bacterium]|nr:hypothetical protein [Pseudomonadota bacterium]
MRKKIDIFLSYAPHEVLSLTAAIPHFMFHNIYHSHDESSFTLMIPYRTFVFKGSIPLHYLVPVTGKDDFLLGRPYDIEAARYQTPIIVGRFPEYVASKFSIEIIAAEKTAKLKNFIKGIFFKNVFFSINLHSIDSYIIVPDTDIVIKVRTSNEISMPNWENIKYLKTASEAMYNQQNTPIEDPLPVEDSLKFLRGEFK